MIDGFLLALAIVAGLDPARLGRLIKSVGSGRMPVPQMALLAVSTVAVICAAWGAVEWWMSTGDVSDPTARIAAGSLAALAGIATLLRRGDEPGMAVPSNDDESALAESALGESALAESALAESALAESALGESALAESAGTSTATMSQPAGDSSKLLPLMWLWTWRPGLVAVAALGAAGRGPTPVVIGLVLGAALVAVASMSSLWRSAWMSRWTAALGIVAGVDLIYDGVLSV